MLRWLVVSVLAMTALAFGVGCDFSSFTEPPTSTNCAAIGARCQLADGPIGICLERPCPTGEVPPCFACTPQH